MPSRLIDTHENVTISSPFVACPATLPAVKFENENTDVDVKCAKRTWDGSTLDQAIATYACPDGTTTLVQKCDEGSWSPDPANCGAATTEKSKI